MIREKRKSTEEVLLEMNEAEDPVEAKEGNEYEEVEIDDRWSID